MTRRRRQGITVDPPRSSAASLASSRCPTTCTRHLRAAALLSTAFADPAAKTALSTFANAAFDEETGALDGGAKTRLYLPRGVARPAGVVLLHGVHRLGIDEPRLVRFARSITRAGCAVMTPELEEIAAYRIEPATIDTIGGAAHALATKLGRPVGVMGMSFAGGLALLAAADPRFQSDIAFVVAVGAHDDLERVAGFFATDRAARPDGSSQELAAHPYGVLVLVYSDVEAFFSTADVAVARDAIRLALWEQQDQARRRAEELSPEGRARFLALLDHKLDTIGRDLKAFIVKRAAAMHAVSPHDRLASIASPVFLLHGEGDTVIPATETLWLARDVPASHLVEALVSPAIVHVEIGNGPSARERFALVHFMASILAAADATPLSKPGR